MVTVLVCIITCMHRVSELKWSIQDEVAHETASSNPRLSIGGGGGGGAFG